MLQGMFVINLDRQQASQIRFALTTRIAARNALDIRQNATTGAKKTATEPKKAAAEAGTKPGKKMSVEATIKDNETRWEAAIASHDVAAIEAMVASDFMGVSAKGKFVNKSGLTSEQKADK